MAELEGTSCCALSQLVASDRDTLDDLRGAVARNGYDYDDAIPSTIYAITLPRERTLIERLKKLGFKRIFTLPRRPEMPRGTLTFWLRNYRENTQPKFRVLRQR